MVNYVDDPPLPSKLLIEARVLILVVNGLAIHDLLVITITNNINKFIANNQHILTFIL